MHSWATATNICMGTRFHLDTARDCEDCTGAPSRRPNRTGSRACALMGGEGNVRMPSGYFFTFADAGDRGGSKKETQYIEPPLLANTYM